MLFSCKHYLRGSKPDRERGLSFRQSASDFSLPHLGSLPNGSNTDRKLFLAAHFENCG